MGDPGSATGWVAVRPDPTLRRIGEGVWIGGSPLVMFRVTEAGDELIGGLLGARTNAGFVANGRVARSLLDRLVLAGAVHPVASPSPVPTGSADVTVVVPVRDRVPELEALLGALASDPDSPRSTVVVDDGSRDARRVADVVDRYGVELLRHDESGGPAAARNAGLSVVRTSLVAFVDSDVAVKPGWTSALLAQLADERVAIVGPRVASAPGDELIARYERRHSPIDMGAEPALVRPGSRVSYLPAAALLARTDVVRALGGFDESMRFGEDVDLVWRTVAAGHLVRYEPASTVEHLPRVNLRELVAQRMSYGSSAVALDARHPGAVAPVACSPWSAATWALVATGHPLLGVGLAGGSALALARKLTGVPVLNSTALALTGHLGAGRQLARGVVRPWWPVALAGSIVSRRVRRVVAAAVTADVLARRGGVGERLMGVLDDAAYSAGVWAESLRRRRFGTLAPSLRRWP